jgi:hypothetical protein
VMKWDEKVQKKKSKNICSSIIIIISQWI